MIKLWVNKKNGPISEHKIDKGEAVVIHGVTIRGETVDYIGAPNAVVEGAMVIPETVVDGVEAKREENAKVQKKKRGRPRKRS